MASSAEQPIKKRKIYEPPPDLSSASAPEPSSEAPAASSQPPPPLSQEEILRKRRNREEILKVYECYRRLKHCIAEKDPRLMPDLEQAYLGLISASRGCTSVQRLVSEFVPRYALYCPTALEAATKVSINMHNRCLSIIMKGEDADGVAYETVKACIFGLVDICCTASNETPTSSVIQGICSAVFQNVLTFFTSSFEGKDIYQIGQRDITKLQDSKESFNTLKQDLENEEPISYRLFKYRALCLFRIFFAFPKNLLAACFELLVSSGSDALALKRGQYFLGQVTSYPSEVSGAFEKSAVGDSLCIEFDHASTKCEGTSNVKPISDDVNSTEKSSILAKKCLLGMVIDKDLSLKDWIISRYKKLCELLNSKDASDLLSFLGKNIGSLLEMEQEKGREEGGKDSSDPEKYVNDQYLISLHHSKDVNVTAKDHPSGVSVTSSDVQNEDKNAANIGDVNARPCWKLLPHEANIRLVNESLYSHGKEPFLMKKLEIRDYADACPDKTSFTKAVRSSKLLSSGSEKEVDSRNNSMGENLGVKVENYALNIDTEFPGDSAFGGAPGILSSPKQNLNTYSHISSHQILWYLDGDSAAMDVFPASKQLWVGSLGHGSSETLVRLQFEDFGPVEKFMFLPSKDCALVEYRNIMDAVRARGYMQASSPWGGCLDIKFLDTGLGCKGAVNGTAVGESCHVYIGKVKTKWAKDEIVNQLMTQGLRNPMITDLTSESALLLEFGTAEEATIAMTHIRRHRKENRSYRSFTTNPCANDFRNKDVAVYRDDEQYTHHKLNHSGSFASHGDLRPVGLENKPGNYYDGSFTNKPKNNIGESVPPPGTKADLGLRVQNAHAFQSNWRATSNMYMLDVGFKRVDEYENKMASNASFTGPSTSHAGEQIWQYKEHVTEPHMLSRGSLPCPPITTYGVPTPQSQTSFVRPNSLPPNSPWESCARNPPLSMHHPQLSIMPFDNRRLNPCPPLPFIPSSITPLSQLHESSGQHFDQLVTTPSVSILSHPLPPQPHIPRPLPSFPPPLPLCQPPSIPPPPTSPPLLQLALETSNSQNCEPYLPYQWHGTLSKSGVHYCTIHATREDSSSCKYANAVSEPADWPTRLDVTKRTDIRHVKTTFSNTPSHKREVCRLLPSTTSDHKGFHDFISYLRQRECAGVIKIPSGRSLWARLLFILPHSLDTCSLLAIASQPVDSLIALILPKETNSEVV